MVQIFNLIRFQVDFVQEEFVNLISEVQVEALRQKGNLR